MEKGRKNEVFLRNPEDGKLYSTTAAAKMMGVDVNSVRCGCYNNHTDYKGWKIERTTKRITDAMDRKFAAARKKSKSGTCSENRYIMCEGPGPKCARCGWSPAVMQRRISAAREEAAT